MPTILDSFVIALNLDDTQYRKGNAAAQESFKKTRDAAIKTGKEIEDVSKRSADALTKMAREVATLFAVFATSVGIKNFITQVVQANAELGRFSERLAESPQTVAAWGAAAERMGGSAATTAATFEKIGKALYDLRKNAQLMPKEFSQLQAVSGMQVRTDRGVDSFLEDVAAALKKVNEIDPAQAHFLAQGLGIDDATASVMVKYGAAVGAYIDELKRLAPTDASIEAAQKLQASFTKLAQVIASELQRVVAALEPILSKITDHLGDWVEKNREWIETGIVDAVKNLADFLRAIDWNSVGAGFTSIMSAAGETAKAIAAIVAGLRDLLGMTEGPTSRPGSAGPYRGLGGARQSLSATGSALGSVGASGSLANEIILGLERVLDPSLMNDNLGDVDGRPVSKSNPLPVVVTGQQSEGGGFWGNLFNSVANAFGMASPGGPAGGSMLAGAGGSRQGGGGGDSSSSASVPNVQGMTADERNKLGLIMKYESHGRNVMNYEGRARGLDPATAKGYTAQGYYQILNSNWRRLAPKLGINAKNAMAATLEEQTRVALALLRESGIGNWSNYNPALRRALLRGEDAGAWARSIGTAGSINGASGIATGAVGAASLSTTANDNRATTSNSSVETHIGRVDIHTKATDAEGISRDMSRALSRQFATSAANMALK